MKKTLYLLIVLIVSGFNSVEIKPEQQTSSNTKKIIVDINKNIETIGIILDLSDLGDYILDNFSNKNKNYELIRMFRNRFEQYKTHPAVIKVNELANLNLIHLNHYYYGLTFSELPEFKPLHPTMLFPSDSLSEEEVKSMFIEFDQSIRDFYKDAGLDAFFTENKEFYQRIKQEIEVTLPDDQLPAIESFYGNKESNDYLICPSAVIPNGFNFGPDIKTDATRTFHYITGPAYEAIPDNLNFNALNQTDSLGFDDIEYIRDQAIHEFGHSFVRFIDKPEWKALISDQKHLNTDELMQNLEDIGQDNSWETAFEEHLVRAGEIMITRNLGNPELAAKKLKMEYEEEGIIYIHEFVKSLEKYEQNRKQYPSLESYFPTLIKDLSMIKP